MDATSKIYLSDCLIDHQTDTDKKQCRQVALLIKAVQSLLVVDVLHALIGANAGGCALRSNPHQLHELHEQ